VLFLDDSQYKQGALFGHCGFVCGQHELRPLTDALGEVKQQHGVPSDVELKWSPDPSHYLRTKFTGARQELYNDALALLDKHGCRVLGAIHFLSECYGPAVYNWPEKKTALWATKQQLTFLAERFQINDLEEHDDVGAIINDDFQNRADEDAVIEAVSLTMAWGTEYSSFDRICLPPLTANSKVLAGLQLADLTAGVLVGALGGNVYSKALFDTVAQNLMWNPHKGSIGWAEMFSSATLGYGLKIFPTDYRGSVNSLFQELDKKYIMSLGGRKERKSPPAP
jgi:hypothetical protein